MRYIKHRDPGSFRHTELVLEDLDGGERIVEHLHTSSFIDGAVPRDSRVILDLVFHVQELVSKKPGPVIVHCSGGAGRTGTFIAVFKLVEEYDDDGVEELDVFDTVLTMWKQRMKMVNKPEHYAYVFKCLNHYVTVNLYTL